MYKLCPADCQHKWTEGHIYSVSWSDVSLGQSRLLFAMKPFNNPGVLWSQLCRETLQTGPSLLLWWPRNFTCQCDLLWLHVWCREAVDLPSGRKCPIGSPGLLGSMTFTGNGLSMLWSLGNLTLFVDEEWEMISPSMSMPYSRRLA